MNVNINKFVNILLFSLLIYFCITYFLKLNYSVFNKDEIIYLSDSLLLLEGLRPSHSHSPSGISTWFGSLVVLLDFLISNITFASIEKIFSNFDLTLYKHYQNLTYIKGSLYFLNSILLFILFYIDKKKIFFLIFFILFLLPKSYEITFTGTPYFTGSILCGISFLLKDKNKFLSLIIFGLAISERIEFLILINFLCYDNKKYNFKNFFIILITFLLVSPWFSAALSHHIKTWLTIVLHLSGPSQSTNLFVISQIFLALFILVNLTYAFVSDKKIKFIYIVILIFSILFFSFTEFVQIRWLVPGFILLGFELSLILNKNNNFFKISLGLIFILLLTYFNNKSFISDDEILKIERNSPYKNVIGLKLLKEDLNFKTYDAIFGNFIRQKNIKNINFFQKDNAPLSFGKSGNFEFSYHRRYDFLIKYSQANNMPNKFIQGSSGLHYSVKEWCAILNKKDTGVIYNYSMSLKSCENIN